MEAQPALKRKRDDGASAVRDPNFYFEDGNIVLSAKDCDDGVVYFRLHKSILKKHSPVFGDMTAMPQPPTEELYDGVSLVEMAGDSAEALRSLIALLYDPQCIPTILNHEDFATFMYEPVVLARKYQIDWIREMAAFHLKNQWPLTLAGWDRVATMEVTDARAYENPESYEPDDSFKLTRLPEPVTAIRLARECDVAEVLPLAFLHLLRQPLEINPDPYDVDDLHARVWQVPERQLLTTGDLERIVLARERIGKWFASRQKDWEQCESPTFAECHSTTVYIRCEIATAVARDGNVLAASQWILQNGLRAGSSGVCSICRCRLRADICRTREEFFERLSTFFNV